MPKHEGEVTSTEKIQNIKPHIWHIF